MEWSLTQNKLLAYHRLMRTDKPIGTLLLLWPTLWALWLATPGVPPLWILAVFVAGVVGDQATFAVDLRNRMPAVQMSAFLPRRIEQLEQRTALQAHSGQPDRELGVTHVHHRPARDRLAVQPRHWRAVPHHRRQQAQLREHRQPHRLQQETRTHRPRFRRPFEHVDVVAVGGQHHRRRLPARTVADDGYAQRPLLP